jgi:hypothetical protein
MDMTAKKILLSDNKKQSRVWSAVMSLGSSYHKLAAATGSEDLLTVGARFGRTNVNIVCREAQVTRRRNVCDSAKIDGQRAVSSITQVAVCQIHQFWLETLYRLKPVYTSK